jgi:mannonate dehydratase
MKLALTVNCWSDIDLMYASQFGVTHVVAEPAAQAGVPWDARTLSAMRNRVQKAGLELAGLDGMPQPNRVGAGPVSDEEIEAICRFIAEAGMAGIPLVVYSWDPAGTAVRERLPEGRGRAAVRRYECHTQADPAAAEVAWEHLTHLLRRVMPVAEKAGVRMACRAGDPPGLPAGDGAAGWPLDSVEALQRLVDAAPSPFLGLDFRQGVIAQLPGVDLIDTIRRFGGQHRIFLVEIGNLQVKPPYAVEAFLDERTPQALDTTQEGATMLRALQAYQEVGFGGAIRPARPPGLVGDTKWGHKGQAFNLGYLRALMQVAERTR